MEARWKSAFVRFLFLWSVSTEYAHAGGIVTGQLAPEQEPLRCAVFAYEVDKAPTSPYAAPLFAAPCAPDGSFSMMLPEGTYLIGAGISIGGHTWAAQPDPARRLPLVGPQAQKIIVRNGLNYRLKAAPAADSRPALTAHAGEQPTVELSPPDVRRMATVTLTGLVRDKAGRPLANAVVQLREPGNGGTATGRPRYLSAPTDASGKYRIEGVAPERYVVCAFKSDPDQGLLTGESAALDLADPTVPLAIDVFIRPDINAPMPAHREKMTAAGNGDAPAGDATKLVEPLRGTSADPF